jgi:hypothetical protein
VRISRIHGTGRGVFYRESHAAQHSRGIRIVTSRGSQSLVTLPKSLCVWKNPYTRLLFRAYISAPNKVDSDHLVEQKMDGARIDVGYEAEKNAFYEFLLRILQN